MKKLLTIAAIALACVFNSAPSASAQSGSLTFSNFSGSNAARTRGSTFTFDITLNFTSGGNIANVQGLSFWLAQLAGPGGSFTLALTGRDTTGSLFQIVQTDNTDLFGDPANPAMNPPRNMPLSPINVQGAGSPYPSQQNTDLGALSNSARATGAYLIAHMTMTIGNTATLGNYTIGNTTSTTPGVGGRISVYNDNQGTTAPISASSFTFTVVPEPSSIALVAIGLMSAGAVAYRRRVAARS